MAARISPADAAALGLAKGPKRQKYGNTALVMNGQRFDSLKEAERFRDLQLLERAGEIEDLRLQVRFDLHALGGLKITSYVADFTYVEKGKRVVEDVKGGDATKTRMYLLKRKWMAAEYDIEIRET